MGSIDPALHIRSVTLAVSDLPRSVGFYQQVLGLPLIERGDDSATLGAQAREPALILEQLETPTPLPPGATGLYHVAWLHPSREALAASLKRVHGAGWPFEGASDHGVSEALYLSDPDGLGIELYADRPPEQWQRGPAGRGVNMVTLPLDLEDLLSQSPGDPPAAMAEGTSIGHVHLKVADVSRTSDFYRDGIGLDEQAQMPSAAFLSAGGYHHHVGLNSWQSAAGRPAPESAPALRRLEFALRAPDALPALQDRLSAVAARAAVAHDGDGALTVRDPDGQLLAFSGARDS